MSEYNYIGIDPSLISTALVINDNIFNFCRESSATTKKGLAKWFKMAEQHVKYEYISYREYEDYSTGEIIKLKDYDKVTSAIIDNILANIDPSKKTRVAIEGYSYGSGDQNSIIDLVTFSTLLRKKLFDHVTQDITIISPTSLKLKSCQLTYIPIDVGKKKPKFEYKNNEGISGGKFLKSDMFKSLIENTFINSTFAEHCSSIKEEILTMKTIPKPYEDVVDAYLLYLCLLHGKL